MKKILSIVFLVIPLLLFTSACGEETQAQVTSTVEQIAPAVQNAVEKTVEAVEAVESATMEAVESVVSKEEQSAVESTEVVVEEEQSAVESTEVVVEEEESVVESTEVVVEEEKPAAETEAIAVETVAMATPNPEGGRLFSQNCAACHAGGRNLVNPMKTLQKQILQKYSMYSKNAIAYQVTNGKNAMPAFGSRLSSGQIEHLAEYVLAQADKGW